MEEGKQYNIGLELLRALMCFEVVLDHFWVRDVTTIYLYPFQVLGGLAVPVFMIMSFFLMELAFIGKDKVVCGKRLWRIAFPQIGWALIYWIAYKVIYVCLHMGNDVRISDMLWQIFTGHSPVLNASMWYQTVLFVLTIIFFGLLFNLSDKLCYAVFCLAVIVSFYLQYSGLNIMLFGEMRYELKYPLGRLSEMIPYAVIGFLIAHLKLMKYLENHRIITIICASVIAGGSFICLRKFTPSGFGYSGVYDIVLGICIFIVAYVAPLDRLPKKLLSFIGFVTQYTLGIYCMHRLVATCLKGALQVVSIEMDGFVLCVFTYIISFAIAWTISKIPVKQLRQLVA